MEKPQENKTMAAATDSLITANDMNTLAKL